MTPFTAKPIIRAATLGERLREVRAEAQLSVDDAARATGVSARYLEALEQGEYAALPGDIYTRNFLRRYARLLRINEENAVRTYDGERSVVKSNERRLPGPIATAGGQAVSVLAKRFAIGLVIVAIVGYLGIELGRVVSPPKLVVESPAASGVISTQSLEVRGRTDPEASVVVNGQAVAVSQDGRFQQLLNLIPGRNTIQITAATKRGKQYTVSRDIFVESSIDVSHR